MSLVLTNPMVGGVAADDDIGIYLVNLSFRHTNTA
jgi:hypothetical protein